MITMAVILFSCSGDSAPSDNSNPDPTPDPDPTVKVTYNDDIQSVVSANCTSCHGNPTTNSAPMSLVTYDQVKNNIDIIISRVNSSANPMPPTGQLPTATRSLFQQWKDGGLLEN
ncbi:hypothetical protein V8G61_04110 [Gaetbulibacter sp. M240]|uniref:hypothetical protein n=1 Tax=Gaetbulibacter sp. M240 TaxID=3126511 RepID=UPI00374FBC2C